jgi:hypothetical protein
MKTNEVRDILMRAEIKRMAERLQKKELCLILDINYAFYLNSISGNNTPSKKMGEKLSRYLEMSTREAREAVFAVREPETVFHAGSQVKVKQVEETIEKIEKEGELKVPKRVRQKMLESASLIEYQDAKREGEETIDRLMETLSAIDATNEEANMEMVRIMKVQIDNIESNIETLKGKHEEIKDSEIDYV